MTGSEEGKVFLSELLCGYTEQQSMLPFAVWTVRLLALDNPTVAKFWHWAVEGAIKPTKPSWNLSKNWAFLL